MAFDLTKDTANHLNLGLGDISAELNGSAAVSIHCWINIDGYTGSDAAESYVFAIGQATTTQTGMHLLFNTSGANDVLRASSKSTQADGFQGMSGTTDVPEAAWHSVGLVCDFAGDNMKIYLNRVEEISTSVTFGNNSWTDANDHTENDAIGADRGTPTDAANQVNGKIGELGIWRGDIGATGYAMLGAGYSASLVSPNILIRYVPLVNNLTEIITGETAVITGTVGVVPHPRIIMPSHQQIIPAVAAVGGAEEFLGRQYPQGVMRGVMRGAA